MHRIPASPLRVLGLGLLLTTCNCVDFGHDVLADEPRISDLTADPNPAREGDSVKITFTAWDAGGGRGGDWRAVLVETPAAGGHLEPEGGYRITSSPLQCVTRYVAHSATQARIEVWVTARGDCPGIFCAVPTRTVTASLDVTVLPR